MDEHTELDACAQAPGESERRNAVVQEIERGCDEGLQFLYTARRSKNPGEILGRGWQDKRPTREALKSACGAVGLNIGYLLGEASGGVVDADLDCFEVVAL